MTEKIYVRFGEIPENERSKIHRNFGDETIGEEIGVSCWDAVKINDRYCLVAPNPPTETTYADFSSYAFPNNCMGPYTQGPTYVVSGDEVGRGADNEPLIRNVKILETLPSSYFDEVNKE